jgi:hypothetical protein
MMCSVVAPQKCTRTSTEPNICSSVSGATVTRAAAPVRTTGLSLKLLVMVLSLSGSCTRTGAKVGPELMAPAIEGFLLVSFTSCSDAAHGGPHTVLYAFLGMEPGDMPAPLIPICVCMPRVQVADVQLAFNGGPGYANFLRNCSYGKTVYSSVTVRLLVTLNSWWIS